MCGKLCKCCKTCKHCEEYEALDLEYLSPEPAHRCKVKNRDIWFFGIPRPFCNQFETKSETSNDTFDAGAKKLYDAYKNLGSNAESVSKILNSAFMSANEVHVSELHELEDILKPCPICGEKPRIQMTKILTNDIGEQVHYHIGCVRRCGQIRAGLSLKLLIESWNGYAEGTKTRPTIKPKSTNCPNCGAPVDIHAEKCVYCDTPYI